MTNSDTGAAVLSRRGPYNCRMQLSRHFSLAEFLRSQTATRLGIDNTPGPDQIDNLTWLCVRVLQPLRDHFGPVTITSGYRCPALNARIGGSASSQHCHGEAADIVVPGTAALAVCRWIEQSGLPFDQLIHEGNWTHVSYCSAPRGRVLTAHFAGGRATYSEGL